MVAREVVPVFFCIVGLLVNVQWCLCSACVVYAVTLGLWVRCASPVPVLCFGIRGVALFARILNL